jgi:hypothetical protein
MNDDHGYEIEMMGESNWSGLISSVMNYASTEVFAGVEGNLCIKVIVMALLFVHQMAPIHGFHLKMRK